MADAFEEIDRQLERLRRLDQLPALLARRVAPVLKAELLGNVRRGVGPDGEPWPPTADGHLPLQGAARDLDVSATGAEVVATLSGVHARHHLGAVRGRRERPILPVRLDGELGKAVQTVVDRELARELGDGAR